MLQVLAVPPSLSPWLDGAVIVRMGADQRESRFPAMPRAMLAMQLARPGDRAWCIAQPPTFHALSTAPTTHEHAGAITALGLIVRPAAAACLLGPAGGSLTNQALPWAAVVGEAEAARLTQHLQGADTELGFLQLLMASFGRAMSRVAPEHWHDTVQLCDAVAAHGARAGELLGIGRRQLERRCMKVLGVSPKHFERLERFHRALTAVVTQDTSSLAQESIDAGYYDQSHLALEARTLAGASVLALKSQAAPHTAWWALSTPRALQVAACDPLPP